MDKRITGLKPRANPLSFDGRALGELGRIDALHRF
jgi:hypothetical protein